MASEISKQAAQAVGAFWVRRLEGVSRYSGWLIVLLSLMTLAGWLFHIDWLKYPFGGHYVTKVNTCWCFLLAGLSLTALASKSKLAHKLGLLCAVLILAMAGLTICEYMWGVTVLPNEYIGQAASAVPPGRMPVIVCVLFILSAWGILGMSKGMQEVPAIFLIIAGLLGIFAYVFGIRSLPELYGVGSVAGLEMETHINLVALSSLVLLGMSIFLSRPGKVMGGLLVSSTRGGYIARSFLPLVVGVPLFFGCLTLAGEHAHLYNRALHWVLFVNGTIFVFLWFTCFIASRLDEIDRTRLCLEDQKADIVYSLAHDLKVPIIGIERAIDLLLSGRLGELHPKHKSILSQVLDSANDQLQLIENLVYEYRAEKGMEPLAHNTCCVTRLLNDCLAKMVPALRSRNLQIKVEHKVPLYAFKVDAGAMRRVINNLLHNAMKYTPLGGKLKISSGLVGPTFSFTIWNSADMSQGYKKHVFERFWQSDEARRLTSGNGLGLYVCRQIVEAHGGSISCLSQPNEGTAFTVTLPTTNIHLSSDD